MNKSISKAEKMKQSTKMLKDFELIHSVHNNGLHWRIQNENYSMNLYPTTHSWHDPETNKKGKGIESFLIYINKLEPGG